MFLPFIYAIFFVSPSLPNSTSQETQNDSDKLKRDRLLNEIRSFRVREKDLLDFVKQNEAMDPEKAVKLKSDIKAGFFQAIFLLICRMTKRERN